MLIVVLWLSIIFQFIAVVLAVRLIPISRGWMAWLFFALALVVRTIRLIFSLIVEMNRSSPRQISLVDETLGLIVSILLVIGVYLIGGLFVAFRESEKQLLTALARERAARVEQAESEARYRAIGESIPFGIWITDSQGKDIYQSQSFLDLLGMTLEEVRQRGWFEKLAPEVRERIEIAWAHTRETGAFWDYEYPILGVDGQYYTILSRATPVRDAEGRVTSWAGLHLDITARKQAEEEIEQLNRRLERRTMELEAANRELEAFSYSVSHDLRAPLRSIDGFSQALLEDYGERFDAVGKDYLHRVRAAAQRMAQLIDDMLRLSRITRTEMHREPVDLSALVTTILAELQERDPQRQAEFVITPDIVVTGDQALLHIMLQNLLDNAWKFTRTRPVARIEFGAVTHDGEKVYFVRDNGVGFEMAYVDKLFTAFQRLHTEAEFSGTGIGLAIAQRIIYRHHGRIWAESAEGQGATFYFTLGAGER